MVLQPHGKKLKERVIVLVKALPHAGRKHGETVCCAGVTEQGEWRRQFPIHFRRLQSRFSRWDIIEYEYRFPESDKRQESRRVQEDTIQVIRKIPSKERATFLASVVVRSTEIAAARGQTLALIRPKKLQFKPKKKTPEELSAEQVAYREAASQGSFFDKELAELQPCPYAFKFVYEDELGCSRTSTCDDWETAAMFFRFEKEYGEQKTLQMMQKTFEVDYPAKGMAFAMGVHSQYPKTWLLVGVLRLDDTPQASLDL
ncbi:MAG: hypothetical protein HQL43_01215 [Alphaproteobacteria bacterium]|nr:hypothetical protein [Alphaproteobacteria bacterium]